MKKIVLIFVLFTLVFFNLYAQVTVTANTNTAADVFKQEGIASWYGKEYDGRPTASGEIFDSSQLTAAHPSLPFGTRVVVTNQHNNKSVIVRINDRGPFVTARIIDVSRAAAEQLDMIVTGTAPVLVESVDRIVVSPDIIPSASVIQPVASTVFVPQPVTAQIPNQIKLIPEINIMPYKMYRLQVGSFRIARNAVDAFEKLKDSGLNPAYERYTNDENIEYFRVVLAGVSGTDVQLTAERIRAAGFSEALIREEN